MLFFLDFMATSCMISWVLKTKDINKCVLIGSFFLIII